ncbi:helix-turn-helix domain-containing protein [Agrobacterium larrymoorei]|uniref:helix-turn-helix domain-containing protein n=1 Tax=Agrobacterium larrymoorei TaxID=160699 RepID=UPI0027D8FA65|nr:LysR family transcriptional regulator [Agrobacterium larrymoorei]
MIDPGKSDLSLRLLEIFDAIMRCGTTVEAAEQLGISQPAVSNGIRQLETQTGRHPV